MGINPVDKPPKKRRDAFTRARDLLLDCLDLNNIDIPEAVTSMVDIIAHCSAPVLDDEEFEEVVDALRRAFVGYKEREKISE